MQSQKAFRKRMKAAILHELVHVTPDVASRILRHNAGTQVSYNRYT